MCRTDQFSFEMDNRNKQNENLGVNKLGKNIRKSPLHQPNFPNPSRQQPEPQVYNINKNDFRNIVQRLTGPNSQQLANIPPPHNPPKPQSERLQKIRPPPLTPPVNRPPIPIPMPPQHVHNNGFLRPPVQSPMPVLANNVAESPVSAYMRYLQSSMLGSGLTPTQPPQTQFQQPVQEQPPALPPALTSPRGGSFPPLPSPQFPFPSPSNFFTLSPFPLLSPGYKFPPPLSPNFALSPLPHPGIGSGPQPPLSPSISFPLSPSGFFPFPSPTWRGQ